MEKSGISCICIVGRCLRDTHNLLLTKLVTIKVAGTLNCAVPLSVIELMLVK